MSNTTKDKLFSVIAHDLRSPFSAMIGLTQILAEDIDAMSHEEIKKTMLILKKETEHSFELLNNLLIWARTQLKNSMGTDKEQGTGLGLQICKEFIELNGGRIWVDSTMGKGSSFHFSLASK